MYGRLFDEGISEADNLITAVKAGISPDVDIHLNFRTHMEQKAFFSTWCRTFLHTRENDVFFLNALGFLLQQFYEKDHSM